MLTTRIRCRDDIEFATSTGRGWLARFTAPCPRFSDPPCASLFAERSVAGVLTRGWGGPSLFGCLAGGSQAHARSREGSELFAGTVVAASLAVNGARGRALLSRRRRSDVAQGGDAHGSHVTGAHGERSPGGRAVGAVGLRWRRSPHRRLR